MNTSPWGLLSLEAALYREEALRSLYGVLARPNCRGPWWGPPRVRPTVGLFPKFIPASGKRN